MSCHAGLEGKTKSMFIMIIVYLDVHVGSHLDRDKAIQKISNHFFWKNINEDIRIFVQHCDKTSAWELMISFQSPMLSCILLFQCQMFGTRLVTSCGRYMYNIILITYSTNRLVSTSLVHCPPPQRVISTYIDYFSKWPEAAPLKDKDAASVALFLFETFCRYVNNLGK